MNRKANGTHQKQDVMINRPTGRLTNNKPTVDNNNNNNEQDENKWLHYVCAAFTKHHPCRTPQHIYDREPPRGTLNHAYWEKKNNIPPNSLNQSTMQGVPDPNEFRPLDVPGELMNWTLNAAVLFGFMFAADSYLNKK